MVAILQRLAKRNDTVTNPFAPEAQIKYFDSLLKIPGNEKNVNLLALKASAALKVGRENEALATYGQLIKLDSVSVDKVLPDMALAYMRLGERNNCMANHNAASCIFPIKDGGIHTIKTGSVKAIEIYEKILKDNPNDLESKWLLNIAFMTLGNYPKDVPQQLLIPGLDTDTGFKVKPFMDIAAGLGLDINGKAGAVSVDDFNNDGYLDIITTGWGLTDPMHYFQNNKDGTFSDMTAKSGLKGITGGSNIQQMDYNNDGNLDLFISRGGWNTQGFGNQPGSLLRNNGDGTFTDVTTSSGLLYYAPSQTAVWADFNNDGWLDVFVGTENINGDAGGAHTCALYINNHDGTFTNVAEQANCAITAFVKGVTAADFNNDGWPDLFLSTMDGKKYLLKNTGKPGKIPVFEDVSGKSGIANNTQRTFTTWFFDYNNDGWPDILASAYDFNKSLAYYAGAEGVGHPVPYAGNVFLFRNNRNGTFTDITAEVGLDKAVFSMGGNFGDIDNDGYPDMYFGTGNPDFKSLIPNRLFKNIDGKKVCRCDQIIADR